MRSQARWDHRAPDPVDPPDDWVNGSWTVDCVCGVNFDDGEEMVNCDECGVWVHTRCSRYVKSEKLFACDKCKSRKNKKYSENDRIDEEETETEVAQLLVDLPARTLRRNLGNTSSTHGFQRRVWTPKEERVHVQGVPGGDVGIFSGSGLSSAFGAELWKSTGYVPKKFNFQYKEFDCWNEGNDNLANNGVNEGGLSLLTDKAGLPADSVSLGAGTQTAREESEKKKGEGENCGVRSTQKSGVKRKDRSLIHYRKSKKENSQSSKDVTGKKKATVVHAEGNGSKKRSPRTSRSASTPSSEPKNPASHEGRGVKVDDNVVQSGQHDKIKGNVPVEPSSKGFSSEGVKVDDLKKNLAFSGQIPETSCVRSQKLSLKARPNDECDGLPTFQNTSRTGDGPQSLVNHNDSQRLLERTEDVVAFDNINDHRECVRRGNQIKTKKAVEHPETILPQVKDPQNDHDSYGKKSLGRCKHEETQVNINSSVGVLHVQLSPPCDGKLDGAGPAPLTQQHDLHLDSIKKSASLDDVQSVDQDAKDLDINTVAVDCQIENAGALSNPINLQINEQLVGSDNSRLLRGSSLEIKQERPSEELSESRETNLINTGQLSKRKTIISLGKSSSTTATTLLPEAPASDSHRALDQQNVVSEQKTSSNKDSSASGYVKDRERSEKPKKSTKELPNPFTSSVKTSIRSKIPGSSNSTKTLSESKESTSFSSAKVELVQNISSKLMSGESANFFQSESAASHVDNTATTLGPMQRSEMVNHSSCQPSSKLNHTPQIHPSAASNTSATLSDEELALLLHHELNSSPRVPRVPRMRHAGSLPQLASPTGANMLMKRSSSSTVGKDHGLVFKRKGKGIAKDGIQNSQELQEESRNVKRSPLLPVQRTNDLACTADSVTRRDVDYGLAAGVQSVNKNMPRATSLNASNASLASSDTSERNLSSTLKSPQNASDDTTGTDVRPTHRTLPGLLSEIMTKRMTYEELCNAVLPHWPNLRKHNGERYAYSSHSQAVLDCLRNRSEWARLVDRGPKTNAGRKRRRSDAEPPKFESDDNVSKKKNASVDHKSVVESSQDQFPKGKRNARKRQRRLALQGRGPVVKRGRRQKEADDVSYDEDCSLPSSSSAEESAESLFSDDETKQGNGGTSSAAGQSEGSASE